MLPTALLSSWELILPDSVQEPASHPQCKMMCLKIDFKCQVRYISRDKV